MTAYEQKFNRWFRHALGCRVCSGYSPKEIARKNLCAVGTPLVKEWMKVVEEK